MMYPYFTLPDETLVTHSQVLRICGEDIVEVHFERPIRFGFDSARCQLPSYKWILRKGYSDDEIAFFEQLLKDNAHLFFEFAKCGGLRIA